MPSTTDKPVAPAQVVLTGNPNCGKTTVFNALTGLRAKVGNYPGVTVERKEGRLLGVAREITMLDLPGTYSLSPNSPDEQIARDVLLQRIAKVPAPDLVVIVVDASNLHRNLYFATQVIELGYRTILALNMVDVATQNGKAVNPRLLSELLEVPVIPLVASQGSGIAELRLEIVRFLDAPRPAQPGFFGDLPPVYLREIASLAELLGGQAAPGAPFNRHAEALLLLGDSRPAKSLVLAQPAPIQDQARAARRRLEEAGLDWGTKPIEARYARIAALCDAVITEMADVRETLSDRLDRVLTHKIWGVLIFLGLMTLMFNSIFILAKLPMEALDAGVNWLGQQVGRMVPPGDLHSLLEQGVFAGVGAVVVFLPQICILFLFIGLLEDTGYMSRAAFIMDRFMSKVGLQGKCFIPLLSSYACAIPGIMATRTIENFRDRLATILIAPLMSCSARLPVYTLLIAACIPDRQLAGWIPLQSLTMLGLYLLGTSAALLVAWLFKSTFLKGPPPLLIMELPPYKRPTLQGVLLHMWQRARMFLQSAGTLILCLNIVLWFLATYPHSAEREQHFAQLRQAVASGVAPAGVGQAALAAQVERQTAELNAQEAAERLQTSFAGRMGRFIEPVLAPLGFDWKIGIGIIASFAAREVFVSTMSTVYSVGNADPSASNRSLVQTLREQVRPDGGRLYTPASGLSLMVFYVFALQCASTVAIVRRETNSWKWPVFQWCYLAVVAWIMAFATCRLLLYLGF